MNAATTGAAGWLYILVGFILYLLPAIIADHKKKKDKGAILLLNLLLGWTCLGWIIALVWAVSND